MKGAMSKDPSKKVKGGFVNTKTERVANEKNVGRGGMDMAKANKPMERLSPGVYRSAGGGLVTQKGRQIPRQAPPAPMPQPAYNDNSFVLETQQPLAGANNYNPFLNATNDAAYRYMDPGNTSSPQLGMHLDMGAPQMQPQMEGMYNDMMYRGPAMPQMPTPSANMGGQYRLSPGVYGTEEQAKQQYYQNVARQVPSYLQKR